MNIVDVVQDYLGKMVKFNLGMVEDQVEVKVIYEDDYDLKFEYAFRFNKDSKETRFYGNKARSFQYSVNADRNEEFEQSLVQSFASH